MKQILIAIIVASLIIFGAIEFGGSASRSTTKQDLINNVRVENGKQIIEILARGGYSPRKSIAKAGIPTILRFNTTGTFDCSASVRIPSMNISKLLPQSGSTDIEIGSQTVATLSGTCGMGMYPFEVDFQ